MTTNNLRQVRVEPTLARLSALRIDLSDGEEENA
jgi:hypothetical protein